MIEPKKAAVRPRVIAERARGTVLLEDLVEEMASAGDVAGLYLYGPAGAGTTTALQHLAFAFGTSWGLRFIDIDCSESWWERDASGLIAFPSVDPYVHQGMLKCTLAGWGRDEWIEYLLAAHKSQCASVMNRLQNDPDIGSLDGNPCILKQVLDEMATDDVLPTVRSALCRIVDRHFSDVSTRQAIAASLCVTTYLTGKEEPRRKLVDLPDLSIEQDRLLHVSGVRILMTAEGVWHDLQHESWEDRLPQKWSRQLLCEVAAKVAVTPAVQENLQAWINSRHRNLHPLAVSLFHAAAIQWEWPRPRLLGFRLRRVNLAGAILDGADCSKLPLAGCFMDGASLVGARLNGADLQNVYAGDADFEDADLHQAKLTDFSGMKARFVATNLSAASGDRTNLIGVDLSFANLRDVRLTGCAFNGANLANANFENASLEQCFFVGACLDDADFRHSNLKDARLSNLDLTVADFRHASFRGALVDGCNFEGIELPDVDFESANLDSALMTGSFMPRANFLKASLKGARLAEVEWESVNLRGVDMTGATFHMGSSRSGLVGSTIASEGSRTGFYTDEFNEQDFKSPEEIRKANLRGSDLRGASIDGVDFYLVDLRDALYDADQEEQLRRTGAILETRTC